MGCWTYRVDWTNNQMNEWRIEKRAKNITGQRDRHFPSVPKTGALWDRMPPKPTQTKEILTEDRNDSIVGCRSSESNGTSMSLALQNKNNSGKKNNWDDGSKNIEQKDEWIMGWMTNDMSTLWVTNRLCIGPFGRYTASVYKLSSYAQNIFLQTQNMNS